MNKKSKDDDKARKQESRYIKLVKKYGDWSDDYIIPQVFVELQDGTIKHVLTGRPEGIAFTKRAIEKFLTSEFFKSLTSYS